MDPAAAPARVIRDADLKADDKLYRIVGFTSVAEVLDSKKLYVPAAWRFEDSNEGIDGAIARHSIADGPLDGLTRRFETHDEFVKYQKQLQWRTFVLCWSKTRESVAMWKLYSPNLSAVRMTTEVGRLQGAMDAYLKSRGDPRDAPDDDLAFALDAKMVTVDYREWSELLKRLEKRKEAYRRLGKRTPVKAKGIADLTARDRDRLDEFWFEPFSAKDASYKHEQEIRGVVERAAFTKDELRAAMDWLDGELLKNPGTVTTIDGEARLLRLYMNAASFEREGAQNIYLPASAGFITEVAIDPRCEATLRKC